MASERGGGNMAQKVTVELGLSLFRAQDPKGSGHRAFGFVTFSDEGVADKVADKSHEILGCKGTELTNIYS
uniref:RRM domain-containing protein n=1 Tax=Aegilops tauschii TaxID=37682 RepID=M8BT04_AEGTA